MLRIIWYILGLCLITILLGFGWSYYDYQQAAGTEKGTVAATAQTIDAADLRFSNTQVWYVNPYPVPAGAQSIPYSIVDLVPPPPNTSSTTRSELTYLHTLTTKRTPEKEAEIIAELEFATTLYNNTPVKTLVHSRPHTATAITYLLGVGDPVILEAKKKFDRVRPSFLDPTLTTTIPVPKHGAYPSAHAAHSYLLAFLLSELDPEHQTTYLKDAARISRNRELAGVHYPSDSRAGMLLAEQIYTYVTAKDGTFQNLMNHALVEWGKTSVE